MFLTKDGWKEGPHAYYENIDTKNLKMPANTVEIWLRRMSQSSPYAKEDITWQCILHDNNIDDKIRFEVSPINS